MSNYNNSNKHQELCANYCSSKATASRSLYVCVICEVNCNMVLLFNTLNGTICPFKFISYHSIWQFVLCVMRNIFPIDIDFTLICNVIYNRRRWTTTNILIKVCEPFFRRKNQTNIAKALTFASSIFVIGEALW